MRVTFWFRTYHSQEDLCASMEPVGNVQVFFVEQLDALIRDAQKKGLAYEVVRMVETRLDNPADALGELASVATGHVIYVLAYRTLADRDNATLDDMKNREVCAVLREARLPFDLPPSPDHPDGYIHIAYLDEEGARFSWEAAMERLGAEPTNDHMGWGPTRYTFAGVTI